MRFPCNHCGLEKPCLVRKFENACTAKSACASAYSCRVSGALRGSIVQCGALAGQLIDLPISVPRQLRVVADGARPVGTRVECGDGGASSALEPFTTATSSVEVLCKCSVFTRRAIVGRS